MSAKTRISLFIVVVLGLHAIPVIFYQSGRQTTWPFLAWSMYAQSYPAGPIVIMTRKLTETSAGGKSRDVTPKDVGRSGDAFRNAYIVPIWSGDSSAAWSLMGRLNAGRSDPIVELRLRTTEYRLADTGIVVDTLPVKVFRAPSAAR